MSDIKARLLLNTSDYDAKIGKAKRSTNDFASSIASKAGAAIGKFAAGIGVAMGGLEAFKNMMDSTQTTGDIMRGTMHSLKTSVDEFFYSINRGNLSSFLSNLSDIASKAKEAYGALDQLGNTQISYGVLSAKNQASIAEAQYLAKNKFAPTEKRISAFGDWATAITNEEENIKALQRELVNTVSKTVGSRITANIEVGIEDVIKAFETDLKSVESRKLAKSQAEMGMRNYEANAKRKDWTQEQKDALAEVQKQNIITYTMLEKFTDEQLQQIAQQIQQYYQLTSAVKGLGREYNETANKFNNANKGVKGFNPVASLSGYTVYSGGEASKNFGGGASSGKKKGEIKPVFTPVLSYDSPIADKMVRAWFGEKFEPIEIPIVIEEENIEEEDIAGKWAERTKKIAEMNAALGHTGEIFSSLGGIMGSFGNEMGAWIMNSIGSVAQMVKELQSLATARGVAEAASKPFPLNLAAMATVVATVASIFSSLPKFADGGVVGGSSFFGDKLLARVNSGEMILNQGQQARLLSMTEGGNVRVTGDVRLNGKDIYISLRNYMASSGNKL